MILDTLLLLGQSAQAESPFPAWVAPIASTGVVGVVLLLVISDKWLTTTKSRDAALAAAEGERDRLRADLEEAKRLLRESQETYTREVIPAFTRSVDVNREYLELLRASPGGRRRAQP